VVAWLSGSALVLIQRSYSTSGPVNTWLGDRLWVNHLGTTSHLGQLSLSSFQGRQMSTGILCLGKGVRITSVGCQVFTV